MTSNTDAVREIESRLAAINPASRERSSFTIRGTILNIDSKLQLDSEGRVYIIFAANAFALVKPTDIVTGSITEIAPGDDPSGRNSLSYIELKRDAEVKLCVGHTFKIFKLNNKEREFYIDEGSGNIVYIDELSAEEIESLSNCYKRVYVVDCYCCRNNKFRQACYGWVGCPNPGESGWYDRKCCP